MKITSLQTEYFSNPLGLGEAQPRFFWRMESERAGARQVAYRLVTASSDETLNNAPDWDSGWVQSNASTHIAYKGAALASRQRVFWRVEVEDENGDHAISDVAWFEMGLLQLEDWSAQWIETPLAGGPQTTAPVPCLRKDFGLQQAVEDITSARLYITALGIYECHFNGQRVGDHELAPGWTDYDHRVRYQTYDVAELIKSQNDWQVFLGDGWYCGSVSNQGRQIYGDRPRLLAQLEVTFRDGSLQTIVTDESWQWSSGPILEADLLMGQSHDARREYSTWQGVSLWTPPADIELSAPIAPPVRVLEEIKPRSFHTLWRWPLPEYIFDMGQNMVGRVRLKVNAPRGTTITLRFAEVLQGGPKATDGDIYTANLRSARQTDVYTCRGDGEEIWEPKFTFHGFRYVAVLGVPSEPDLETITGVVLSSDNKPTGSFSCSDPLLNQLQRNIEWGWKGNSLDIPTDCPQRDERLGWTGDAQVFSRTAMFLTDSVAFWREWARSVTDAQGKNGSIPAVVPNPDPARSISGTQAAIYGGPAWADAVLICPWTVYRVYGDKRVLEENYSAFEGFLDYLQSTARDGIRCYDGCGYFQGFGDWLAIDGSGHISGGTHYDLIGTAFYAHAADLMSQIARVLDKPDDAEKYRALHESVKAAFQGRYITPQGLLSPPFQTPYLLALHFNLLPDELRANAAHELVREIKRRGNHLSTGFVGCRYVNHELTREGHLDVAYQLLHQENWPGWLYAVTQGATTIWERWDGWTHDKGFQDVSMNSFNHYAYGAVGSWLYEVVAGIDLDENFAGYQQFRLAPRPGGKLTSAKAHLDTLHGRIESEWKIEDGKFSYRFVVPPNTQAQVELPNGETFNAQAGVLEGSIENYKS